MKNLIIVIAVGLIAFCSVAYANSIVPTHKVYIQYATNLVKI